MTSFPRFEEAFDFFVKEEKISLFEVFKEICGEKRKYITFRRMLKAYLIYKNFPQNLTLDTKKFFDFVLRTLMILYFLLQLIIGVYIVYHFSLSFIIYRHTMTLLWLRIVISICTALLISILISIFTAIIEMCCSLTDNTNIYSSFLLYCKALIL